MERYKSATADNYSREYDTSSKYLPYIQSNISELRENEISRLFRKLTKIDLKTFYKILFEEEEFGENEEEERKETKFLQEERLYALADHLMFLANVRKDFPAKSEKACEMFLEDTNSTLDFGSLLIYFQVLKGYMEIEQVKRMEEMLTKRQNAEQMFVDYFFDPKHAQLNIRSYARDFQYVFFLAFAKVFLREEQQRCINLLVDTLESIPKLKELLIRQRITPELYFHEFLYKKLTTSTKSVPLDQLKCICSNDWGNVLAVGGQAGVDLVTTPGLPVPVVAKLFFGELATSHGLHEAFVQMKDEIRTLLTTQCNPHIVSLYGYVVNEHRIQGLLMEYCKGGSLYSVIKSSEVDYTESSIVRWSRQAACGLEFIHVSNTIHRDVKPQNMLLDEYHQLLKIGDLGIVKMGTIISDVLHCEYTSDLGTPEYRAPEIIDGNVDTCTPKVDVFGLGRSIWSMIFRCDPKEPLEQILTMKVTVSPTIWDYVQKMMAHDPDLRPTMAEVFTFFEGQLNRLPTQLDPAGHITTQPASRFIFNAPFDNKLTYPLKITNTTANCIGWAIKFSNMKHLSAEPSCGRLGPNEAAVVAVSCGPFVYGQRDNDDCIVIEWTKVSDDDAKEFCHEWFQDDGVVHKKKKLSIEYNP